MAGRLRLLFLVLFLQNAQCLNLEGVALLEFRNQVIRDPRNIFSSWNVGSPDPCSWRGITCEDGRVVKLLIHGHNLTGTISPALSLIPHLRTISLSRNQFTGFIPPEIGKLNSLRKLNLSHNALAGGFPFFVSQLQSLRMLDLSSNALTGLIPDDIFQHCTRLRYIALSNNAFLGRIPSSLGSCTELTGIDLASNLFFGYIPPSLGQLQKLEYLSLQRNKLLGQIPPELGSCVSIKVMDLSSNGLTGILPTEFERLQSLEELLVNDNALSGTIPPMLHLPNLRYINGSRNFFSGMASPSHDGCQSLELVDLSSNALVGKIGVDLLECEDLRLLNLSHNQLSANIPDEIGELSLLHSLDLSFNNLSGILPDTLTNLHNLAFLDLGRNPIGGGIPHGVGEMKLLVYFSLETMSLEGPIPESLGGCKFLLDIRLSNNTLSGTIPASLGDIKYLRSLKMDHNKVEGPIPAELARLANLEQLDFSYNNLSGSIPPQLGRLRKLQDFNVSFNNLTGLIPRNGIMVQFNRSSYVGNPFLCGQPLTSKCNPISWNGPALAPMFRGTKSRVLSTSAIIAISAAAVVAAGVAVVTFLNIMALKGSGRTEVLVYESSPPSPSPSSPVVGKFVLFSTRIDSKYENWQEGTKALADKDCVVGYGPLGTVYKTVIEGAPLAMKKLSSLGDIKTQEEFEQEIAVLGRVRHRNLVALEGYYWSQTTQLLLSEFLPNDSLFHHLHDRLEGQPALPWWRRFKIAQGTARAVAYLHHDCRPRVLLFNLKATNILLDDEFEPHLSDYGLRKLLPKPEEYLSDPKLEQAGAGYMAPEMAVQNVVFSEKCDVYSFGVVLLELVSGRRPVENSMETEVVVLSELARQLFSQRALSFVDAELVGTYPESEVLQVMRLGLLCTAQDPSKRPTMSEVVQMLELYAS